jgi:hypothetical protein
MSGSVLIFVGVDCTNLGLGKGKKEQKEGLDLPVEGKP